MKNKKIMYVIMIIFVLAGALCLVFSINKKEKSKIIDYDKEYEQQDLSKYKYVFINNYDDYKTYIEEQKKNNINIIGNELSEDKFNGSRYLLLTATPTGCRENLSYSNTKFELDTYKIYFNVNYTCGVCASESVIYQIKVGASETDKILVFYKTLSEAKCDKDIDY